MGDEPKSVSNVVLPSDSNCESPSCRDRLSRFDDIVNAMKAGEISSSSFFRMKEDGVIENIHAAFAPVKLRTFRPIGSDFESGLEVSEEVIYSLGLFQPEEGLLEPFEEIRGALSRQIWLAVVALSVVIAVAALFIVYISYLVATSITEPMLYLLELIRCINR